jgi:hypothetical protein
LLDTGPVNHRGPDSTAPGLAHRIIIEPSSDPFYYSRLYFTSIIGFLIKNIFMRMQHEYLKQATPVFTKLRIRPCLRISWWQIRAHRQECRPYRNLQAGTAERSARTHPPGAPSH